MKQLLPHFSFSRAFSRSHQRVTRIAVESIVATSTFVSRLGFLPANISPLGSYGFFGNPVLYALSILLFDLLVKGTYAGFLFTYAGFAMYPVLGWLTRRNPKLQLLALPSASFSFFIMSNFGVWWHWYDHTWSDLLLCYTLALPFYSRTLLSDLTFGYGFMALRQFSVLREKTREKANELAAA